MGEMVCSDLGEATCLRQDTTIIVLTLPLSTITIEVIAFISNR